MKALDDSDGSVRADAYDALHRIVGARLFPAPSVRQSANDVRAETEKLKQWVAIGASQAEKGRRDKFNGAREPA